MRERQAGDAWFPVTLVGTASCAPGVVENYCERERRITRLVFFQRERAAAVENGKPVPWGRTAASFHPRLLGTGLPSRARLNAMSGSSVPALC